MLRACKQKQKAFSSNNVHRPAEALAAVLVNDERVCCLFVGREPPQSDASSRRGSPRGQHSLHSNAPLRATAATRRGRVLWLRLMDDKQLSDPCSGWCELANLSACDMR